MNKSGAFLTQLREKITAFYLIIRWSTFRGMIPDHANIFIIAEKAGNWIVYIQF